MSVRCRPDARQLLKRLRLPQSLHLVFEFGLADMIFEGHCSVDEHDGDLLTILLLQFWIVLDIDDAESKRQTGPDALDDLFGVIAEMTTWARVDFHLNASQKPEKLFSALYIDGDLVSQCRR